MLEGLRTLGYRDPPGFLAILDDVLSEQEAACAAAAAARASAAVGPEAAGKEGEGAAMPLLAADAVQGMMGPAEAVAVVVPAHPSPEKRARLLPAAPADDAHAAGQENVRPAASPVRG